MKGEKRDGEVIWTTARRENLQTISETEWAEYSQKVLDVFAVRAPQYSGSQSLVWQAMVRALSRRLQITWHRQKTFPSSQEVLLDSALLVQEKSDIKQEKYRTREFWNVWITFNFVLKTQKKLWQNKNNWRDQSNVSKKGKSTQQHENRKSRKEILQWPDMITKTSIRMIMIQIQTKECSLFS